MDLDEGAPRAGRGEAFRRFVLEAPLSMALTDLDTRFLAVSPVFLAVARRTLDQVVGRTVDDLSPAWREAVEAQIRELADGRGDSMVVKEIQRPDGERMWLKCQASYWRDDAGAIAGYLFINHDVTAEHAAELQRREAETLLLAVMDNIPAGISVVDLESETYLLANARTLAGLGLSASQMLGKRPADLFPPDRARLLSEEIRAVAQTGDMVVSERTMEFGPAAGRIFLMKKTAFDDASGRRRLLSVTEDVTETRQATEALERAAAEARAANAAKSVFLANMSHEIRTPLNGVMGIASALARTDLTVPQAEMVHLIEASAKTLAALLSDILDLARVEAGRLQLECEPFEPAALVDACGALFEPTARAKGLDFEVTVAPDAAGAYVGDALRIRQILSNLLSNAIKFTTAGSVRLTVSRGSGARGRELRFEVRDTGIGFDADTKLRLFSRFEQADGSITRSHGGTGLGLAISRALAELMGGRLEASATPGQGATFSLSVDLPRCAGAQETQDEAAASDGGACSLTDMRILLADDHPTNRRVVELILGAIGVEPTAVENGAEAVAAFKEQVFDLVLMDIQMPVMDGLTAIRAIRAMEARDGRSPAPIYALTANAMNEHVASSLAAGADGHLSKPIDANTLITAVEAARRQTLGADRSGLPRRVG